MCLKSQVIFLSSYNHLLFFFFLNPLSDIPEEIACDIPPACSKNFIKLLLENQKWHEVLLLLTRTTTGQMTPGNALIKSCDLSDLDIGIVLQCIDRSATHRVQLLKCLMERGGEILHLLKSSRAAVNLSIFD